MTSLSLGGKERFLLYLIAFLVMGQFLYFLYNISENTNENGNSNSVEIMKLICRTVEKCIMGYFETFQYCWYWTLYWMWRMISDYMLLLGVVVSCLSAYPANIIFVTGGCIMLLMTYTFLINMEKTRLL